MANFKDAIFTNAGLNLIAEAVASKNRITYTRATLNNATDDEMANAVNLTVLSNEQLTADIDVTGRSTDQTSNKSSYTSQTTDQTANQPKDQVTISVSFDNNRLTQDINYTAVGWYAKSTTEDETLIAVTPSVRAETMQAGKDDQTTASLWLDLNIKIDSSADITLVPVGNDVTQNWVKATITASVYPLQQGNTKSITDLQNNKADKSNTYTKDDIDGMDKKNVKSASINGGAEILPDEAGKLELVVPDPDLSKYVSLKQLTETLKTKADKADTYTKSNIDDIHSKSYFRKQGIDQNGNAIEIRKNAIKLDNGGYAFDIWNDDWTASKLHDVLAQLPNKADTTTVNSQVEDAKNTAQSKLDQAKSDLTSLIDNIKNFNVDSYKGSIPSTDMNKITDAGLYGFSNAVLTNSPYTGSRWGLLLVIREFDNDPNNIDQFITSNGSLFWRNISLTNNRYPNWNRFADDGDIAGLEDQINTKANASDLSALDSRAVKSVGICPNDLNFTNGQFTNWSNEMKASPDANGYALIDLTDDGSARAAVDQLNTMLTGLNRLQGKHTKDGADANDISKTGIYYCSNPTKNFPVYQWGTLVANNGNGERASQFYFPDDNTAVWFRTFDGYWRGWVRLANIDDVNNAKSSLTSSINAVNNKVNVAVPLFRRITAGNTWNDILGANNGYTPVLVSIRDEGGANTLGNFSAAVAFGGGDTKGVLNVSYSDHTARIIGGNGNAPVWHEDIAWKSDVNDLRNQIQQLRDNQFEVQTFTDATAAANWEAQRPGKRMAIVNS